MPHPLTVDELVRSPALQLSVVAGGAGLGRRVAWAHVSELEDPSPWLLGGELLMTTGIAVPRTAARQADYLRRLDDGGVSALAVSEGLHVPRLSAAMLEVARERSIPVLRVPLPVPFVAIAQEVAGAVQSEMHRRLTAQLHVFGALRTLAAEDLSVHELFARLERLSGYRLYLCTASGHPLLPGVPGPPDHLVHLVPQTFSAPPVVPGGHVLPVPAPGGPAGFLLALERAGSEPSGLAVVQHLATVAALQLSIRRHEWETVRREGAETLAELLQDVLDPETAVKRLARIGFGRDADLGLAVVRPTEPVGSDEAARAGARVDQDVLRALTDPAHVDRPVLVLRQQGDLFVLHPAALDLARLLGDRPDLAVGLSRPFQPGTPLTLARREALWSASRAADAGGGVVESGRDAVGRWLVPDQASLAALVDTVLGPVLTYDATHGDLIVPSVRVWLERDRRTAEAAASLHVHPNTLAYRVRRFEELSGRSLRSTPDLAEVWLALRAVVPAGVGR
ncbi:MAG: PucR family transcriptional regulator [Actinomycetota bacterium]|nr:PucR family transcriptional regulator [Actinomycetota bacterium]